MELILIIALNPSIDRRYFINDFEAGKSYSAYEVEYTPGGSGLNTAKIIKSFNEPIKVTGFCGGRSGEYVRETLDHMGIEHDFITINDETRSRIAVLSGYGVQTEILEKSPSISGEEVLGFYELYKSMIQDAEIICASGELPRGMPADIYRDLILMAKDQGKKFILDTSGEALKLGIKASPFLIKPSRNALEELMGFIMTSEAEMVKAARYITENGVEIAVISLGKNGAIVLYGDYYYRVNVPSIKAVNPAGAGDAMMAGLAVSLFRDYDFEYVLRIGAACGAANAMESEMGKIDMALMKSIMNEIEIEKRLIW
jgi:tagatose 6-phosphate kinase